MLALFYAFHLFFVAARNNKEPVHKDLPLTQTVMESLSMTEKEYT